MVIGEFILWITLMFGVIIVLGRYALAEGRRIETQNKRKNKKLKDYRIGSTGEYGGEGKSTK